VTLLALHVGAMGVWAGGLVALVVAIITLRRATGNVDRHSLVALVVGFGPIAAISFGTLAATGLLLSGLQVATVTALFSTQYGAVLVAKVGLIGVVALFGLRHAVWTWRGLGRRLSNLDKYPKRVPMTVAVEAAGAIVVVLLASVLGASAPAQGPQFSPLPTSPTITQLTREQDGLLITVSIKPNRPGPNLVSVLLVNTRWPTVAPVQGVTVLVQRPAEAPAGELLATTRSGSAYDAGTITLSTGDARLTVRVVRAGLADTITAIPWRVAALEIPRVPVVVSNQPIAPIVNLLALLAAMAASALIAAGVVRYRRAAASRAIPAMRPRKIRTRSAPDFVGRLGDRRQLGDLVVDSDGVADDRGREAALRT
jgi:copper transport protein